MLEQMCYASIMSYGLVAGILLIVCGLLISILGNLRGIKYIMLRRYRKRKFSAYRDTGSR